MNSKSVPLVLRCLLLALLVLAATFGALLPGGTARAAAEAGKWTTFTPGITGRSDYAAAQLPNGTILVAGGFDGTDILDTAMLLKPTSATWTPVAPMQSKRRGHTATVLADGRVLVIGGSNGPFDLASAEIYDPVAQTWAFAPAHLATGRSRHTATRLANGQVLVAGGVKSGAYLNSAEIYDPVAAPNSTALPAGTFAGGRVDHTATLLPDGRVLLAGGAIGVNAPTNSAFVYTPGGVWVAAPSMADARTGHAATPLKDGRVLVTGGSNGVTTLASATLYDPTAGPQGGWSAAPTLPEAHAWHSATLLPDGQVLVAGGLGAGGATQVASALYIPNVGAAGTWIATGALTSPRVRHAAFIMPGGQKGRATVLVAEGTPTGGSAPAERYVIPGIITLGVAIDGPGTVATDPAGAIFVEGTVASVTAVPDAGALFLGWQMTLGKVSTPTWWKPTFQFMASEATSGHMSLVARFAPRPSFPDVPATSGYAEAIAQLAARGVIKGYGDGRFGPDDTVLRAQMAALIARAMGWDAEDWGTPFADQGGLDPGLWRNVGALAHYGVAYGYGNGMYGPNDPVTQAQTISFITRAMVAKGYWTMDKDDPTLCQDIPAASGHRADIATFVDYTGGLVGADPQGTCPNWSQPATRGWFALALWQALDSQFGGANAPSTPVVLAP